MSKIMGVTVGTPLSPQTIKEKLKKDGFYPVMSVSAIPNGHRITIADTNGTKTVDVMDGEDGKDGSNGKDGYTPVKGVDYFDGKDGKNGVDGKDGYTPVKGIDYVDGKDGVNGKDGAAGADGYTPKKGVDYFTAADKQEMVADVIAALPVYDGSVTSV